MKTTKTLFVAGIRGGCVGPRILPLTKEPRCKAPGEHDVLPASRDRLKTLVAGIVLVAVLAGNAAAQVTRQESTNQLRKVVYSGRASECPYNLEADDRYWTRSSDGAQGHGRTEYYYPIVTIPEIVLTNMPPSLQVWIYSPPANISQVSEYGGTIYRYEHTGSVAGWENPWGGYKLSEGRCYLSSWKNRDYKFGVCADHFYDYDNWTTNDYNFTIVLLYESQAATRLQVQNTGTGKSLELKWQPEAQTSEKIRGYRVFRHEKK